MKSFQQHNFFYCIVLPFPFPQGEAHIFGGPIYYFPPSFEMGPGFISTLELTTLIILGLISDILYEKLTLRRLYQMYLPMYMPRKY